MSISCPGADCWIFCDADCGRCYAGCGPAVPVEAIGPSLLDPSDPLATPFKVYAHGQTPSSLAKIISALVGVKIDVPVSEYAEPRDIEFEGPLTDLMSQFGLRRA